MTPAAASIGSPAPVVLPPRIARAHRDRVAARAAETRIRKATDRYAVLLRKIARHIDDIVKGFDATTPRGRTEIEEHLSRYGATLHRWSASTAEGMLARIDEADRNRWRRLATEIGRGIERELQGATVAPAMEQLKADQVRLITSLSTEAAERVAELSRQALTTGERADALARRIYETGAVSRSRATLIARSETSRAATVLQATRAQAVGSPGYVWETARDRDVRPSHRAMQGRFVAWDEPPTVDGLVGHAGALPNCRCYCRAVLPD